jgi:hypothetical protein
VVAVEQGRMSPAEPAGGEAESDLAARRRPRCLTFRAIIGSNIEHLGSGADEGRRYG